MSHLNFASYVMETLFKLKELANSLWIEQVKSEGENLACYIYALKEGSTLSTKQKHSLEIILLHLTEPMKSSPSFSEIGAALELTAQTNQQKTVANLLNKIDVIAQKLHTDPESLSPIDAEKVSIYLNKLVKEGPRAHPELQEAFQAREKQKLLLN